MQKKYKTKLITIVGPTASGKTRRAVNLAKRLHAEIISGDSRQVYQGMDIGTGKDLGEYDEVPYHLIDICKAGEKYNLYGFIRDFREAFSKIQQKGKICILCGGTGMYIENVLAGIELPEVPENKELRDKLRDKNIEELKEILSSYKVLHNTTDVDSCKRAIRAIEIEEYYNSNPALANLTRKKLVKPLESLIIGVDIPREERRKRISLRLEQRLNEGMIEEVKSLLQSGLSSDDLIYYGLEYKFITLHLLGELTFSEMKKSLEIAIHQFAKRQMTWFRGMEKRGFPILWIPYDLSDEEFTERVVSLL